jgi:hypothetical protein
MPTATIARDDGDPIEADVDAIDLPDGYTLMSSQVLEEKYVSSEFHESEIERIKRRFGNSKLEEAKEGLRQDEEFIQSVIDQHGAPSEEVQKLRAENQKLKSQLEETQERLGTYRTRTVSQTLKEAAREANFDERFRTSGNGEPSYIEAVFSDRIEETEDGDFVMLNDKGERIPAPSDSDRTYARPSDVFQGEQYDHLRGEPAKNDSGPGYEGGGEGGGAPSGKKRSEMGVDEKVAFIEENGREAFDNLPYD